MPAFMLACDLKEPTQQQATFCMDVNRNLQFLTYLWIYDQIKHSKDNKPHLPNDNSKAMETLETKQI